MGKSPDWEYETHGIDNSPGWEYEIHRLFMTLTWRMVERSILSQTSNLATEPPASFARASAESKKLKKSCMNCLLTRSACLTVCTYSNV